MRQPLNGEHDFDLLRSEIGYAVHSSEPETVPTRRDAPSRRSPQALTGSVAHQTAQREPSQAETDATRPHIPLSILEKPPHLAWNIRIDEVFRLSIRANPDQVRLGSHPQCPVAVVANGADRCAREARPGGRLELRALQAKQAVVGRQPEALAVVGEPVDPATAPGIGQLEATLCKQGLVQLDQLPPRDPDSPIDHE